MRKLRVWIQWFRAAGILPFISWKNRRFRQDLTRWKQVCHVEQYADATAVAILLWEKPEFRNLLLYRHQQRPFFRFWVTRFYRPMDTLFIECPDIGGGFFIQHGFSTIIGAKSIGENCWINQQVTIGYNGSDDPPVLEDNVMVTCGAKVLGTIRVGSNAIIGANAVVIRDVEPNAVMGGVPARKLK